MPRTMRTLSPKELRDSTQVFRGELPGVSNPSTAAVARRFDITESDAGLLRTSATTRSVTADRARHLNEAEARIERDGSLEGLSLQQLESLAAAGVADHMIDYGVLPRASQSVPAVGDVCHMPWGGCERPSGRQNPDRRRNGIGRPRSSCWSPASPLRASGAAQGC